MIRLWNPAAERITGLPAVEAVGQHAEGVFDSWRAIEALSRNPHMPATTQAVEIEGALWLSITGVGFEGGSVYAFRDLTAERAVERLKTDFVSTVSRERRMPLAAIYGAALTLRRQDARLSEPQREGLLEVVASELDRLARIVNDILWASRLESGSMQTLVEACDGVEPSAPSSTPLARTFRGIRLEVHAPAVAPLIAADPGKTSQVFANLIDNAVKYSPDGGTVTVDISLEGQHLRFAVQDEGLGVLVRAHEDLREVLSPRPGPDPWGRRHGPRPVHQP